MRIPVLSVMLGAALVAPAVAGDVQLATEIKQVQVGQTLILEFPGNRRAVQRWRLVKERSSGIKAVDVDSLG